jgi:hypothetical protein
MRKKGESMTSRGRLATLAAALAMAVIDFPSRSPVTLRRESDGIAVVRTVVAGDGAVPRRAPVTDRNGIERNTAIRRRIAEAYGKLPLAFETNDGQTDSQVQFLAHGRDYTIFVTANGHVLSLHAPHTAGRVDFTKRLHQATTASAALQVRFDGANNDSVASGEEQLPGKVNYFIGNDPTHWQTGIRTYARIVQRNTYPGIDVVYHGQEGHVEYDFVVAPGANPQQIRLAIAGADKLWVDSEGALVIAAHGAEVRFHKPVAYQRGKGGVASSNERISTNEQHIIESRYVLSPSRRERGRDHVTSGKLAISDSTMDVSFDIGPYDVHRPLVIDPLLVYSSFLGGGTYDSGSGIAVDAAGNAYVVGITDSVDLPTTPGSFQTSFVGVSEHALVAKFNPSGSALEYSTYLGGSGLEYFGDDGYGIAVNAAGNAFVTGSTSAADFPTTPGAFQTTLQGEPNAFVTKLNATGSALMYSTYLGGSSSDGGSSIVVDGADNAYVTGYTYSFDFPTTPGTFQTSFGGQVNAFVAKLDPTGGSLAFSTYLGGSGLDGAGGIAVDPTGAVYVTGSTGSADFPTTPGVFQASLNGDYDAFVAKLDPSGSTLMYSTYLGGARRDSGNGIAVDASGSAFIIGLTASTDFPATPGSFQTAFQGGDSDAFVAKLDRTASRLIYATYLGGNDYDVGAAIAVDNAGDVYVAGGTHSRNFPTTPDAFQATQPGLYNGFVTSLNPDGSALIYSTYLGGSNYDGCSGVATDAAGGIYLTGVTYSIDFPTTAGAVQPTFGGYADGFVLKIQRGETNMSRDTALMDRETLTETPTRGRAQTERTSREVKR